MTRLLKLLLIPLAVFSLTGISTYAQNATKTTVKERMEWIEAEYGVNFVYDSSINMDIPYRGTGAADTSIKLQDALKDLFKGTGMEWDVKRKYIAVRAFKPTLEHIYLGIDPETLLDTLAASRITSYIDRDLNTTQTGLSLLIWKDLKLMRYEPSDLRVTVINSPSNTCGLRLRTFIG